MAKQRGSASEPAVGRNSGRISKREQRRRLVRRRRRIALFVALALLLGLSWGCYRLFFWSPVRRQLTWEAGSGVPTLADFLRQEDPGATMLTHMGNLDLRTPGDQVVEIQIGTKTYRPVLTVIDTAPPEGTPVNVQEVVNTQVTADSFVTNIQDATEVVVSYKEAPDFTKEGVQDVQLVLKDAGGNRTTLEARLTLTKDTEPPVIEGAQDLVVKVGEQVSFEEGVSVSDNHDMSVTLEVEAEAVDLTKPGEYPLIYRAWDRAGNPAEVRVTVTVLDPEAELESAGETEPEGEMEPEPKEES